MEPVRTGLRQLMSELLRVRPAEEAVLLAWPVVCGKEVAARSQAIRFSDGKLLVEVADASWRNQLQSFAPRYISGYDGLLGPLVRSVEFKLKQSAVGSPRSTASSQESALSSQRPAASAQQSAEKTEAVCSDPVSSSCSADIPASISQEPPDSITQKPLGSINQKLFQNEKLRKR